ncbi:bifunctional precorrin-2 dehydrogenase/sirohydrochlorin ferrochelatase [Planctomycetota bacterium]
MAKYPVFLELDSRRAVVVGGGKVAMRKVQSLLAAGARVVVVGKKIDETLVELCQKNNAELIKSKYLKEYLAGAVIVIAATNNSELNKQIYKDCQTLEILCNAVDEPELCDFFVPAIVQRGDLQIAIGTQGCCPAYAGHLRKKLEKVITEDHGRFLNELGTLREKIIHSLPESINRKALLGHLVDEESFKYFIENGPDAWRQRSQKMIDEYQG